MAHKSSAHLCCAIRKVVGLGLAAHAHLHLLCYSRLIRVGNNPSDLFQSRIKDCGQVGPRQACPSQRNCEIWGSSISKEVNPPEVEILFFGMWPFLEGMNLVAGSMTTAWSQTCPLHPVFLGPFGDCRLHLGNVAGGLRVSVSVTPSFFGFVPSILNPSNQLEEQNSGSVPELESFHPESQPIVYNCPEGCIKPGICRFQSTVCLSVGFRLC